MISPSPFFRLSPSEIKPLFLGVGFSSGMGFFSGGICGVGCGVSFSGFFSSSGMKNGLKAMDNTNYSKILTSKEQIILEQMRQHHKETIASFRSIDSKALSILEVSSIIITISTGLQLANPQSQNQGVLVISVMLYLFTALAAFKVLFPKPLRLEPIEAKWNEIRDSLNQDDDEFYYSLLSGYEDSISHNQGIIDGKAWYLKLTVILLSVTVILVLLAVLI